MFERLVWLVPAVVLTAGLWRPRAGMVALAAVLPLFGTSRGGPYLAALDVTIVAAVLVSLREPRPVRSALDLAVLAGVAVALVGFFPLAYTPPSWQPSVLFGVVGALGNAPSWSSFFTWRALVDLVLGWGLYAATRRTFSGRSPRPLALGVAAGLAPLVILGLLEHVGGVNLGGYRAVAAEGRLHSLFFNSGWFAEYVVVAAPFAVGGLHAAGGAARIGSFALLPLGLVALLLAQQRGAWLAVCGQFVLGAFFFGASVRHDPRIRRAIIGTLVATAAVGTLLVAVRPDVVPVLGSRFTRSDLFVRAAVWQAAARLFLARPLLGWGIGSFQAGVDGLDPGSPATETERGEAHSTYLHIAAERGILGLLSLAFLVTAATTTMWYDFRLGGADRSTAIGHAMGLGGVLLYGLVQYMWYVPAVGALVWVLLGCSPASSPPSFDSWARRGTRAGLVIAPFLLAWRLFAVEPLRAAGDHSYGFHLPERSAGASFEWTEGHAARRMACSGDVLVFELANGHPRGARRPVQVTVRIDGRQAAQLDVRSGWEQFRFPVGGACSDGFLIFELLARPTFRPFADFGHDRALGPSRDERELGVAVRAIRFETGAMLIPRSGGRVQALGESPPASTQT